MSNRRVPVASLPGALPQTQIDPGTDAKAIAASLTLDFGHLEASDFTKDAFWRDTYALTGTLRTFHTNQTIVAAFRDVCETREPKGFRLHIHDATLAKTWIDVPFGFEVTATPKTTCSGILSLVPSAGGWKIWVMRTTLEQLVGENDVDKLETAPKKEPSISLDQDGCQFGAVVVGAGQAGLSVAGRLKALGVEYVVLEKNDNVGDNWKLRYQSARLHTTRQYSHLPFNRTFPTGQYQEWLSKDDLARGYQDWAHTYGINIWVSTALVTGTWDKDTLFWTLKIVRGGKSCTIRCAHVILACGAGGQVPVMPALPNRERFLGTVLHSAEYLDSSNFKGKNGIVVGIANTAHDVAEDMVDARLDSVTIVQRSRTYVMPREYYQKVQDLLYNDSVSTEYADRLTFSQPLAIARLLAHQGLHAAAREEPRRFDALEKAGFKLDRYGDIMHYLYDRMGGYYMDVGASQKIADGKIRIMSDSLPIAYTSTGLRFGDGAELPADLIVFATGFEQDMSLLVRRLFGNAVAEQADEFWGVDEEGELLGAFKPNNQPNLWYHGGALGHARYYSRFIALTICTALKGTPFPVYRDPQRFETFQRKNNSVALPPGTIT
ncbi:FAD/NAD(P)-binding domain-containing protein [Polyplosphaeria fusca]|uniref:FAD/NAD(P)-binding domain-containing protein n=1 Tax=Polyplosphaeria fusca TaxID=682080 RepID=A0A9P4QWU6_9PLEO|nr:FAD/NAD(P)-binding domain-containing protein [Polyplosphaeria fusca]